MFLPSPTTWTAFDKRTKAFIGIAQSMLALFISLFPKLMGVYFKSVISKSSRVGTFLTVAKQSGVPTISSDHHKKPR